MPARKTYKTQKKEKGLVLLVLVIIIVLAFVTYSFSGISITQVHIDQSKNTAIALKQAKQALINYAATYSDRTAGGFYGFLPNPEMELSGEDGNAIDTATGIFKNINAIGWLPWRTLDMTNLKDDSGTCLFYAVSSTYKFGASTKADMVNEDSIGMFQIKNKDGNVIQGGLDEDRIVALVIAPGASWPDQSRAPDEILSSCGQDYINVSAYLEGDGDTDNSVLSTAIDDVDDFIHATATSSTEDPPYNDKFLTITRDEIWPAIVTRTDFKQDMATLTQALTMCLANYANMSTNTSRRLPWPVNYSVAMTDYRVNDNYKDETLASLIGYSGRYPFDVANSNAAIGAAIVGNKLFDVADCSDLGTDADGVTINLTSAAPITKYRQLWNNWKDHFFYTLSKRYQPGNPGNQACELSGGLPGECIKVALSTTPTITTEYAASVIFSGSRLAGATRNIKTDVDEYLEAGKNVEFFNETGSPTGDRTYLYTNPQTDTENDIMYCIEDNTSSASLTVIECL